MQTGRQAVKQVGSWQTGSQALPGEHAKTVSICFKENVTMITEKLLRNRGKRSYLKKIWKVAKDQNQNILFYLVC